MSRKQAGTLNDESEILYHESLLTGDGEEIVGGAPMEEVGVSSVLSPEELAEVMYEF